MSVWIKAAAGVAAVRGRHGSAAPIDSNDEWARLRIENERPRAHEQPLTKEGTSCAAAEYFAGETNWRAGFRFVADYLAAFEVKRLCEIVEVSRSSFYAWLDAAPAWG